MAPHDTNPYRTSGVSPASAAPARVAAPPPNKPPDRNARPGRDEEPAWEPSPPDRLIDAKEFANILGISRAAFFRARAAGKIPDPLKLTGRLIRWLLSEVMAWIRWGLPPGDDWNGVRGGLGFGPKGGK